MNEIDREKLGRLARASIENRFSLQKDSLPMGVNISQLSMK